MISFLKSLFRKLLKQKTGAFETVEIPGYGTYLQSATTYDPSEDQEKIMTGEIESYFD